MYFHALQPTFQRSANPQFFLRAAQSNIHKNKKKGQRFTHVLHTDLVFGTTGPHLYLVGANGEIPISMKHYWGYHPIAMFLSLLLSIAKEKTTNC